MHQSKLLAKLALSLYVIFFVNIANAHYVLGQPEYILDAGAKNPSGMRLLLEIDGHTIDYRVYPAVPKPFEPINISLSLLNKNTQLVYPGNVTFLLSQKNFLNVTERILASVSQDNNLFNLEFIAPDDGHYFLAAEFTTTEPHTIDFPLQVGNPSAIGAVAIAAFILIGVLLCVHFLQKKYAQDSKKPKPDSTEPEV